MTSWCIPDDILLDGVFTRLRLADLSSCFRVCKSWSAVGREEYLWKILCERDYGLVEVVSGWRKSYRDRHLVKQNWRNHAYMKFTVHHPNAPYVAPVTACCMAVRGDELYLGMDNNLIDVASISEIRKLSSLKGHLAAITCLAVSGDLLVSGDAEGDVRVWNLNTRESTLYVGHSAVIAAVALHGTQVIAAGAYGNVLIWELSDPDNPVVHLPVKVPIVCMQVDEQQIVLGTSDTLRIFSRATNGMERVLRGQETAVTALAFDGDDLVSAGADGTLWLWDLGSMQLVRKLRSHTSSVTRILLQPHHMLSCGADGSVRVWTRAGRMLYAIHPSPVCELLAMYADETRIIVSGSEGPTWQMFDFWEERAKLLQAEVARRKSEDVEVQWIRPADKAAVKKLAALLVLGGVAFTGMRMLLRRWNK
eukprot:TRINITY_DN2861_c0_g2_i7.p1 TRINITY_DN2861_c0_g2~~TRINITY_DN2861_c0_g2_i7.p1  ORF type:complete len:421 (+),score=42.78 TRINITY_DN2861_c0_g2_i7:73-1335(+)